MRRWFLIGGVLLIFLVPLGAAIWAVQNSQRADYGWRPQLAAPRFAADGPRLLIDEGHHNASTAGIGGRYFPFARLLRADGFRVARGKAIERVATYTGQSLDGPLEAAVLLRLPANAVEYIRAEPEFIEQPAGGAQGLAMQVGAGRVVVLGEAAMLTAQVYGGEHFGLNAPGHDNQQFALNTLYWLAGTL